MDVLHDIERVPDGLRGGAIAIGNFDGVHRGHQAVLDAAKGHGAAPQAVGHALNFKAPVKIGAEAIAEVEVEELFESKRRVILACTVKVGDRVVLEGEAVVMVSSRPE